MASVRRRPGVDGNGKPYGWQVRWIDPLTGKRPSKTFDLKKQADEYKRKIEREIEDGVHVSAAKALTVSEVIFEYLKSREARVKDGRLGQERLNDLTSRMNKHFVRTIGQVAWKDLTAAQVESLYGNMIGAGGLSPHYARANISALRMAERYANAHGYAKTRPVDDAMMELRGVAKPKIKTMTIEDVGVVLRQCLKHKPKGVYRSEARVAIFVHLAACCGMRVGEILALSLHDLDLSSGALHVRRNITRLDRLKGPKSHAGDRPLALPEHLQAMLGQWVDRYYSPNGDQLLFADLAGGRHSGKRYAYSDFHKSWRRLLVACGLGDNGAFHFHSLRHFAGSWWLSNGMLIPDVAKLLGHSDPAFTMKTYIHSLSDGSTRTTALKANAARLMALEAPTAEAA